MNWWRFIPIGRRIKHEYERLGELAKQIVIQTMTEGEKTHPGNGYISKSSLYHLRHAIVHLIKYAILRRDIDLRHGLTRLVIMQNSPFVHKIMS
jgi:hypothetical protein